MRPLITTAVVELITFGGTAGSPTRLGRPADALALLLVAAASGAIAFAWRWPVPSLSVSLACTVAYYALGYHIDSPFFIGLVVTAYYAGMAGERARAVIFVVLTLALFAAATFLGRPENRDSAIWVSVIVVAALVAGQAAAEWRARADRQAEDARKEESLRSIADERLRIARELHDVVSHSISMINVQAGVAVHVMDERPEEARAALVAIKTASRDALRAGACPRRERSPCRRRSHPGDRAR